MSGLIRWIIGLIIVAIFFVINFFFLDIVFVARLVNILLASALMVMFRVIFGPSAADRIVAVDIFGILIVGLLAMLYVLTDASFFIDIAMAWALQSFIVSLGLAKFLEGRRLDD
jgi:multicomponent Na+:H+ antiporter subunit F